MSEVLTREDLSVDVEFDVVDFHTVKRDKTRNEEVLDGNVANSGNSIDQRGQPEARQEELQEYEQAGHGDG